MTLIDNAVLELDNDITGDSTANNGVFEISSNLEVEQQVRTSFLLDNSIDRVLGALNELTGKDDSVKRSGISVDVGGGQMSYQLTFTEPTGGSNSWGDGGSANTDATGDAARRKAEVLMRYIRTGTYGSVDPARLKFGEYNPSGEYENFVPVAIQDVSVTVSAENEEQIEGRITLVEVGTFDPTENDNRKNK